MRNNNAGDWKDWANIIKVYKIVNGLEGIESGSMITKKVGISRGHSQQRFKKRVRWDVKKYCFSNRVCNEWNRLPGEIVNAGSVDSFQGQFAQ